MPRTTPSTILAALLGVGLALPVSAQTVMKLASATINDVQHEWAKRFEAEMKSRVGDKLKVEIYPASQLGAIPRMVEGVAIGTIEAFVTPTSFLVGLDPRFQVFDSIGVFQSPEHLNKVLADGDLRKRALSMGDGKGVQGLGIFYNSPVIVLSRKPIKSLADFKGQKIRVFASPLQIEPIKSLGATAVPMALNEVLPALQTGTIDGLLAGIPVLSAMKFYDAAKAVTEIHPAIVVSTLVVNKAWFAKLPADVQAAALEVGSKVDREMFTVASGIVDRANKAWDANGGQRMTLSAAEQAKMMGDLKALGAKLLEGNAAAKGDFEALLRVADRTR
jgi:TRAP-type transport system periplasmic protein